MVSRNSFSDSERTLEINIVNLCCKLCLVVKAYYEETKYIRNRLTNLQNV